jgi:hypothetical protein
MGATRGRRLTGTSSEPLQLRLVSQVLSTPGLAPTMIELETIEAVLDALAGINPRDELEGMLAVQIIGVHESAMQCLMRAALPNQTVVGRDMNLKYGVKLLQLYAQQLEALARHRGKGQQKIAVEHVTVQAGGQAIVGHVNLPSLDQSHDSPSESLEMRNATPAEERALQVAPSAKIGKRPPRRSRTAGHD